MDGAEALRVARRRVACSQRELALRAGVSVSTVAAIESGARTASLPTLVALLHAAGLELTVDLPVPPLGAEVRSHLRTSLATRLKHAFSGSGQLVHRPLRAWRQAYQLSGYGQVSLAGPLAVGVWLPGLATPDVWEVRFRRLGHQSAPTTPDLIVTHDDPPLLGTLDTGVGAAWGFRVVAPAELALDPDCAGHRLALRSVAAALHVAPCLDAARRRVPAHRDPQHAAEAYRVFHTRRWAQQPLPTATDQRSWRLEDQASLQAWLRALGYPP